MHPLVEGQLYSREQVMAALSETEQSLHFESVSFTTFMHDDPGGFREAHSTMYKFVGYK